MTPWLEDADVRLYHGDVLEVLRELPAESVDCCVTSPPYWGLRDYGTGAWEGGDEGCEHKMDIGARASSGLNGSLAHKSGEVFVPYRDVCGKCGATRIDQQLGLEPTPEQYVTRMVEVFREVRRVLAAHGTVWLNLGDSYVAHKPRSQAIHSQSSHIGSQAAAFGAAQTAVDLRGKHLFLKDKDLVGIPWRVAFALQADGWYLRSDIIWAKPNPMPESVTDRPTKAHEYLFLLSKQPRYYWDAEAVREPHSPDGRSATTVQGQNGSIQHRDGERWPGTGRNVRSVWSIATQPYPEAHFATFPEELARRCIAAGTSERGKCPECGAPWVREVERELLEVKERKNHPSRVVQHGQPLGYDGGVPKANHHTIGWNPTCECGEEPGVMGQVGTVAYSPIPAVILDPFVGSGTVAYVARKLGRHAVGIDLNESYLELAARRLQQQSLFAEVAS